TDRMCGQSVNEGVEADQLLLPLSVGGRHRTEEFGDDGATSRVRPFPHLGAGVDELRIGARRCEQGRADADVGSAVEPVRRAGAGDYLSDDSRSVMPPLTRLRALRRG